MILYSYLCIILYVTFYLPSNLTVVLCSFIALAEIISVKEVKSSKHYYVHYVDCKYKLKAGLVLVFCIVS
jgi:hypothetical protein